MAHDPLQDLHFQQVVFWLHLRGYSQNSAGPRVCDHEPTVRIFEAVPVLLRAANTWRCYAAPHHNLLVSVHCHLLHITWLRTREYIIVQIVAVLGQHVVCDHDLMVVVLPANLHRQMLSDCLKFFHSIVIDDGKLQESSEIVSVVG